MDKIKQLYDSFLSNNIISSNTDFETFKSANEEQLKTLYDSAVKNKVLSTDTDFNMFLSAWDLKKKDDLQPIVQEDATVSATVEEPQPILSEPLEAKYDDDWITSFVKKNESEAKALLSEELRGTQFEVRESGFADDVLKVYNKLTDEDIEIDLSPTFGIVTETDKNNVKKILSSKVKNDATKALWATTNLEDFQEDPKVVVESLKNLYKDIDIDISESDNFGYDITLTKGNNQEVVKSYASKDAKRKAYSKINKFIYENADTSKIDYEEFLNQNAEQDLDVKIDENELIGSVYNNEYFDKLFDYLEGAGQPVDQATKDAILSSKRKEISYVPTGMGAREVVKEAKLSPQEVIGIRDNFIKENQDLVEAFDMQNIRRSESDMIDRAKTLKAETILKNAPNREVLKQQLILLYDLKKEEETQNILAEEVTTKKQIEELYVDFLEKNKDKFSDFDSDVNIKEVGGYEFFISKNAIPTEKDRKALAEINKEFIAIQKSSSNIKLSLEEKRRESISKLDDTKKMYEASRKNYDVLDAAAVDAKNTLSSWFQSAAIGGLNVTADLKDALFDDGNLDRLIAMSISKDKAEREQFIAEFYPTRLDYKEAFNLGRKGEFFARELGTQTPYYVIGMASAGVGSVIGVSGATLAATSFGVSQFGEKIDEANAMQNIAANAKEELKKLEDAKGSMPIDAYALIKYDLERAIESNDVANWQKYTAASAAGLAEGLITRYFGTIPNSAKIIRDFKFGSYIDDIMKSNYKATVKASKDWVGRGLGEVAEETSIETILVLNDALFLDKELDFSGLDDVGLTAFMTSGTTNAPSVAYKTIMNQTVTSKYRNSIKDINKQIDDIKKILLSDDLPEATRKSLHGKINERIGEIANIAASAESDVLLIGAGGVKEMLTLSTVRDNITKKAGVKADDSQSAAEAKMKAYLASLDKTERKDTIGKLNYIDERRKQILGSIDYDGASERIFGEKGKAIEEGLDPKLTPQEKFVEVYKQVREEINTEAKKEYDSIQEEVIVDVPDIKTEEEIEQSRKQEIEQVELAIAESNETGETATVNGEVVNEDTINEINSKYDAELDGLKEKNKIESFANRIIEGGIDSFSDDAIQFYSENKEAIDSLVQEKQKQTPKTDSKVRSLALKIADGTKDFTDAEIDLFSANEDKVRSEVDSIANTRGIEITYNNILDSIKRPRKKVVVDEYSALKDQIRLEARAAREAKKDYKQKLKDLANNVKELVKSGSISTKQSDVITRKLANLNLDNPKMVDRFINYMDKVYNDAEYSDKISKAKKVKADIKRLKNNKEATLVKAAEDFLLIDASKIDDIDKYLEIAEELKEGLTKSTSKRITGASDIAKVNDYNSKTIQAIQKQQLEDLRKEFSEATGLDTKDLSYDDMKDILFSLEPVEDKLSELDKDKMLRDAGKKAIKYYSAIIQSMLNKSVDPFTGDTVEFSNPKLVQEFLKIDFDRLKTSDLLLVVDSMINIATNPNALGGVGKIVSRAKGDSNAVAMKKKGVKTRKVWSVGRLWTNYISSMNLMFENIFGGQSKAKYAEKMVGFSDLQQSYTRADNDVDSQFLEYKKKHKNTKPNGKRFFSLDNRVERAIIARLQRTIPGNEKSEFDRQKSLIEQSMTKLERTEPKLYKIVKEAYDRIVEGSNNIEEVLSKADKANLDGVTDIQAMWAEILPELKRVSIEYYNKVISEDAFYTPDFFDLLEKEVDVEKMDGTNFQDSSKAIYDKETGTIKKNNRIKRVDKRIVSFDFDFKNLMALRDAYRDVYSADNVQQIIGFLNSKEYSDVFVDDNVGDIVKNRLVKYSQIKRNKDFVSKDSKELSKIINRIAKIGVALALASVFQPIKQSVVLINTLLSLGTKAYLLPKAIYTYIFNKDARDFIKRTNATVTRRGISSLASIDSANQLIQEADGSGVLNKTLKGLSKISEASLNIFLVQPDKFAATISFLAFYMSKHDVKDFKSEKVDNDATQYADRKVSRAQAPSDSDTQGNLFTDKRTLTDIIRKMFFPFATFNMNQKTRVYADFRTVFNLFNESKEDVLDATSSIFATTVEIATFHAVGYYITSVLTNVAFSLIGYEEDDEEEEKRKMNSIKGRLSSSLTDVLSPIPLVDPFVTGTANFILDNIQEGEDVFKFFSNDKQTALERFGTLGIAADKGEKIWELSRMIVTRKYKDNYGREIELTNEAVSNMEMVLVPYLIYSLGFLPTDIGYLSDKIISVSKKMKKEDKPKLKYYGNIKSGFRMPSN